MAEELLERIASAMKGGSGFEESTFTALKLLGMLRNERTEHMMLEDILAEVEARSKGRMLRFVLSTMRTIRRVSTLSPDVLDDLLEDVRAFRRVEKQLREGGKRYCLTLPCHGFCGNARCDGLDSELRRNFYTTGHRCGSNTVHLVNGRNNICRANAIWWRGSGGYS
jgi:hypothetical protein